MKSTQFEVIAEDGTVSVLLDSPCQHILIINKQAELISALKSVIKASSYSLPRFQDPDYSSTEKVLQPDSSLFSNSVELRPSDIVAKSNFLLEPYDMRLTDLRQKLSVMNIEFSDIVESANTTKEALSRDILTDIQVQLSILNRKIKGVLESPKAHNERTFEPLLVDSITEDMFCDLRKIYEEQVKLFNVVNSQLDTKLETQILLKSKKVNINQQVKVQDKPIKRKLMLSSQALINRHHIVKQQYKEIKNNFQRSKVKVPDLKLSFVEKTHETAFYSNRNSQKDEGVVSAKMNTVRFADEDIVYVIGSFNNLLRNQDSKTPQRSDETSPVRRQLSPNARQEVGSKTNLPKMALYRKKSGKLLARLKNDQKKNISVKKKIRVSIDYQLAQGMQKTCNIAQSLSQLDYRERRSTFDEMNEDTLSMNSDTPVPAKAWTEGIEVTPATFERHLQAPNKPIQPHANVQLLHFSREMA